MIIGILLEVEKLSQPWSLYLGIIGIPSRYQWNPPAHGSSFKEKKYYINISTQSNSLEETQAVRYSIPPPPFIVGKQIACETGPDALDRLGSR